MVRSRLATWKPALYAIAFLVICFAAIELGLHLHDACFSPEEHGDGGVSVRSWTMHHTLKPKAHIVATNPDTSENVAWRTNSLGLRAPEVAVPKPAGVYRVICLGDESTLAAETEEQQTFCVRLQELLGDAVAAKVEVINAGCPGYGPLLSFLQMRHLLMPLSPDLVILNFDMTDIADDHQCRRTVHSSNGRPLACPHPDYDLAERAANRKWFTRLAIAKHMKSSAAAMFGKSHDIDETLDIDSARGAYAWLRDDAPDWSAYIDQSTATIEDLATLCRGTGCRFILAAVPCPWQISAEACDGDGVRARVGIDEHQVYENPRPVQRLASLARRGEFPFADAIAVFRGDEAPSRLCMKNGRRLSSAGHDLYARVLRDCIVKNLRGGLAADVHGRPPSPPARKPVRPAGWKDAIEHRRISQNAASPAAGNEASRPSENLR